MNKKADMPFWLIMLLWALIGAVVVLIIIKASHTTMSELFGRLG